jgi:RecA/RadA recombinase
MVNLDAALQQLREEREQTESKVQRLDQAILIIESLNGSGAIRAGNQAKRVISAASRRKMARAQKLRRERENEHSAGRTTNIAPARRTMSAAARRKIAAAARARWAKVRTHKKAA